jgi:hypothetical protein
MHSIHVRLNLLDTHLVGGVVVFEGCGESRSSWWRFFVVCSLRGPRLLASGHNANLFLFRLLSCLSDIFLSYLQLLRKSDSKSQTSRRMHVCCLYRLLRRSSLQNLPHGVLLSYAEFELEFERRFIVLNCIVEHLRYVL